MESMNDHQEIHRRQHRIRFMIHFCQGIAVTLFSLATIIAIYLTVLYQVRIAPIINYAIVFDAGSSHTEMFVYYWAADKSDGLGATSIVNELFVCSLATIYADDSRKSGELIKLKAISDFDQHLHLLDAYFKPCLKEAILKIPSDRHKFSPIFLGATAGMRLLRLENVTRSNQILEKIREVFSNYPFQFVTARQVRILTGMEEAIDGWITTNILLEKFKHRHENKKHLKHLNSSNEFDSDMVGVLDLGGASTQVTFTYIRQIGDEPIPAEFTTDINLFETVYSPYAHSYLCWGKNEASKRYRARLVNAAMNSNRMHTLVSSRIVIRDPCLARDVNDTITSANLFRSPCTIHEKQRLKPHLYNVSFIFVGTGNASQCRQRLIRIFDAKRNDLTVNCSYKQEYCTFDHAYQPNLPSNLHFIGLSGYYYVFNNLALRMSKPIGSTTERYKIKDFSEKEIAERLTNVCETPYSTLYQQEAMNPNNEHHKRGLCFDAWYMWLLLTYGIGFKESDLKRLSFANTFPTGKVGWTLGYMINQTNYIPAEYRAKLIEKNRFITFVILSLIIAFITLLFLMLTCWKYIRHAFYQRTHQVTRITKDGYAQPLAQSNT